MSMRDYRRQKRIPKRVAVIVGAIAAVAFVILYIYDMLFGLFIRPDEGECEFHFVDVGQGDCAMIITKDTTVVVDTGPQDHADSTERYIRRYTDTIDYLILTHPHEDHIGGSDELIESINVKNIIMSDATTDTVTYSNLLNAIEEADVNVIEAQSADKYSAGDIDITILAPNSEFTDYNDYSIVVKVEFGNTSTIITGDVEEHAERLILEKFESNVLETDILKLGHHGSYTSNTDDFLDVLSPEYAVITCGIDNEYGHPHIETLERLELHGIEYFRTDENGHIVFRSDGKALEVLHQ